MIGNLLLVGGGQRRCLPFSHVLGKWFMVGSSTWHEQLRLVEEIRLRSCAAGDPWALLQASGTLEASLAVRCNRAGAGNLQKGLTNDGV